MKQHEMPLGNNYVEDNVKTLVGNWNWTYLSVASYDLMI
jgi:hypothetical protein